MNNLTQSLREALGLPMLSERKARAGVLAVLRAIREPSEAMNQAALGGIEGFDIYWGYYADGRPWRPEDVFAAMIDALISDLPPPPIAEERGSDMSEEG